MPGSITFRPIEANLTHNTELLGKMNPYCAFVVGESVFKGQICKHGGKHPQWNDSVTIPFNNQSQVIVEVMDKDRFTKDDHIGSFLLNLNELQTTGQSSKWYPLTHKNKPAGEILLQASFTGINQNRAMEEEFITRSAPNTIIEEEIITEQVPVHERRVFTEQQQVVEPRTFLKEVDVVETRPHVENIEVLEPTKVLKEVQYTEAVPVTKQIEVTEPVVVKKEVEVIEPRLVTKTIQVVENVPVMKEVEVIENVTRVQEVQSFEQQTFTKQVEVTDYVPVQKQVTVTEPVHLKKAVEYVEDVVTTKTVTKEIMEPVVVDQSITTTIGPASVIGESEVYGERFAYFSELNQEERLLRTTEYKRLRGAGLNDLEIERQFETRGWFNKHHHNKKHF